MKTTSVSGCLPILLTLNVFFLDCPDRALAKERSMANYLEGLPAFERIPDMTQEQSRRWRSGADRVPDGFDEITVNVSRTRGALEFPAALYVAPGEGTHPLVIVSPGIFGTCRNHIVGDTGALIKETGEFHVLLLSTRNCEEVARGSRVAGSGGLLEGRDLLRVVQWARADRRLSGKVGKVGVVGMSLSGNDVVQALAADGDRPEAERVLSCGFTNCGAFDLQSQSQELDAAAANSLDLVRGGVGRMFQRDGRKYVKAVMEGAPGAPQLTDDALRTFLLQEYLRRISWAVNEAELKEATGNTGLDLAGYLRLVDTSSRTVLERIRSPLFAVHCNPDWALAQRQADAFAANARLANADRVVLRKTEGGNHLSLQIQAPEWFGSLMRGYFRYWLIDTPQSAPPGAEQARLNLPGTIGLLGINPADALVASFR